MRTKHRLLSILFLCGFLLSATSFARASDLFTYQGKLANAQGTALANGQYRIGVRIWDVASGGDAPLWARKYQVPVVDGLFSLMIGSTGEDWNDPAPLTPSLKLAVSGTSRFLEITVMSDANGQEKLSGQWQTLTPRQALGAVPYAFNGVPPGTVVPFAGSIIPKGWILCDGGGGAYSSSDSRYSALFATIQATFGNNGAGTFRFPDLRGRVVAGTDDMGGSPANRLTSGGSGAPSFQGSGLGATVGVDRHTLTDSQMAPHTHAPGSLSISGGDHSHNLYAWNTTTSGGFSLIRFNMVSNLTAALNPVSISSHTTGNSHPPSEWSGSTAQNSPNGQPHSNV